MSNNPPSNPPRGPRNMRTLNRGRGQPQNSSDPTPSPQRQHPEPTQSTQRHSDPFVYDTQSLPYWDASLPPSSPIPSLPPRHPARTYAQIVGSGPGTHFLPTQPAQSKQEQHLKMTFPVPQKRAANPYGNTPRVSEAVMKSNLNPYADIVGSGPYGPNQATYSAPRPPTEPKAMRVAKKVEFTPYFDPTETRNDKDLRSPKKSKFADIFGAKKAQDTVRPVLGSKDENAKLRQDATAKIKAATPQCNEEAEKLLQFFKQEKAVPKTPVKMDVGPKTPTAPVKPKGILKDVAIPKSLEKKKEVAFSPPQSEPKPLSTIVEAPWPLKISASKQASTPTLDHIRAIRASEQAKALAALEGNHVPQMRLRESETPTKHARKTSREEKRKGIEFLPNVDLGDSIDWGKSLHDLAAQEVDRDDGNDADGASSSAYSSDNEDEIDKLTKAIAGLRPFQDLPSPTPRNSFRRKSAVPEGLDLKKIKAVKQEPEEVAQEKTSDEAMAEVLEALEATEAAARGEDASRTSSKESLVTLSSDDYEQVGSAAESKTDQNGAKRRWLKGFRKS